MNVMKTIEQFIEGLFRDESKAQAFIRNPETTMREAGLQNATPAQVHAVAATAAPSVAMGGGDPVVGLQRAVASHHGIAQETFATTFHPQRVITQQEAHDDVVNHQVASPTIVNNDSHDFNLGLDLGDITFGNKTTAVGDGAVAIGGNNSGGIQSGKGSIHGNDNDVNNGSVKSGDGSPTTIGDDNDSKGGSTKAGGDAIDDNKGPVVKGVGTGGEQGKDGAGEHGKDAGATGTVDAKASATVGGDGTDHSAATAQSGSHVIDTNHPGTGAAASGGVPTTLDPSNGHEPGGFAGPQHGAGLAATEDGTHINTAAVPDTHADASLSAGADAHMDTYSHDAAMHDAAAGSAGFEGAEHGLPGM